MSKTIFLLLFLISFIYAVPVVEINNDKDTYDNFEIAYQKDSEQTIDIHNIEKVVFIKTTPNKFTLGYTKGNLWFKFQIKNLSESENLIIYLGETFYEKANLYYEQNGKYIKKEHGLFTPIKQREVKTNHLAFEVNIPKSQTQTFYMELQGKYAYFGNIKIIKKEFLGQNILFSFNAIYIFIFGIIFSVLLFNTFLYLQVKEKIYLYYLGFAFFNLIYLINISGILVFFDMQHYIYKLHFTAAFMPAFLILFSRQYLDIKTYLPKTDIFLQYFSYFLFMIGFFVIISYQPWNKVINNAAGLMGVMMLVIAAIVYFKGHSKSKYYIFAMIINLIAIVLFTMMVTSVLEYNTITRYGYFLVAALETILFSLLLSQRYHALKDENEKFLELKIEERTRKLKQNYSHIKTLLKERELLLKEVHHRVKNNFHMILGLLWIEEQNDNRAKSRFEKLRNRIKSMSMIHEKLYNKKDIRNIHIKQYLNEILGNLSSSNRDIQLIVHEDIENITFCFESALSLGIIVNEVVTNSIKHNDDLASINIVISLVQNKDTVTLIIKDNGHGFDKDESNNGIGMDLIANFSQKLNNGHYEFINKQGTQFILYFEKEKKNG